MSDQYIEQKTNLVVNKLSRSKFNQLIAGNQIKQNEIYIVEDTEPEIEVQHLYNIKVGNTNLSTIIQNHISSLSSNIQANANETQLLKNTVNQLPTNIMASCNTTINNKIAGISSFNKLSVNDLSCNKIEVSEMLIDGESVATEKYVDDALSTQSEAIRSYAQEAYDFMTTNASSLNNCMIALRMLLERFGAS